MVGGLLEPSSEARCLLDRRQQAFSAVQNRFGDVLEYSRCIWKAAFLAARFTTKSPSTSLASTHIWQKKLSTKPLKKPGVIQDVFLDLGSFGFFLDLGSFGFFLDLGSFGFFESDSMAQCKRDTRTHVLQDPYVHLPLPIYYIPHNI